MVVSATPVIAEPGPDEQSLEGRIIAASNILENPKAAENVSENNPAIGELVTCDPGPDEEECKKEE